MSQHIINSKDIPWNKMSVSEKYEYQRKKVGRALGTSQLGCSLYELPPGKRTFPYHFHYGNEELFYVLSGEGTVRTVDGEHFISKGDFISALASPEGAHQIINTSQNPLRILAISTMNDPDVVEYPDSEKVAVMAGAAPGGDKSKRSLISVWQKKDEVDYWKDEA